MNTKQWVDPPSGWRWGFPKMWDPRTDPDIKQWFIEQGLPETELEFAMNWSRYWSADEQA